MDATSGYGARPRTPSKELLLSFSESGHGTLQDVDKVRASLLDCVGSAVQWLASVQSCCVVGDSALKISFPHTSSRFSPRPLPSSYATGSLRTADISHQSICTFRSQTRVGYVVFGFARASSAVCTFPLSLSHSGLKSFHQNDHIMHKGDRQRH